jgi:sugar phosphate isomerase/epimerase
MAEKLRLPLAVENHKDQRNDERVALFRSISSEFVGACVDTGNSIAILEDPMQTIRDFAPWAKSVHLKDQAFQVYDDGFLLGDLPLGQGGLDLKQMVQILRAAVPKIRFSLELITRDPLRVNCLTDEYFRPFPDTVRADRERTMNYVKEHLASELQYPSQLTPTEQVALEDQNIRRSLQYARQELGL